MKDYNYNVLKIGDQVSWDPEQLKEVPDGIHGVPSWVLGSPGLVVKKGECQGDFIVEFKQGDKAHRFSFAQNWFLEPQRKSQRKSASERASKAAREASVWHQGSGIHADGLHSACQHFEEQGHTEVAELLADAAEAEAAHLKKTNGAWFEYKDWRKTASGKATRKAEAAAKKVDPKFRIDDWS